MECNTQADTDSTGACLVDRHTETYRLTISTHVLYVYASCVLIASLYVLSVCIYRHASVSHIAQYSPKTMQVTYCLYIQYIESMYRGAHTHTHTHTHTKWAIHWDESRNTQTESSQTLLSQYFSAGALQFIHLPLHLEVFASYADYV